MQVITTYHCQNPKCRAVTGSKVLLYGEPCPECGVGHLDDWPVDADMGDGVKSEEEQYWDDLNSGYAQDRM